MEVLLASLNAFCILIADQAINISAELFLLRVRITNQMYQSNLQRQTIQAFSFPCSKRVSWVLKRLLKGQLTTVMGISGA